MGVLGIVRAQKERSGSDGGHGRSVLGAVRAQMGTVEVLGIVQAQKEAGDRAG